VFNYPDGSTPAPVASEELQEVGDTVGATTQNPDQFSFDHLPDNQQPVMMCIAVTGAESGRIQVIADDLDSPTTVRETSGFRVDIGEGRQTGETWSLFMSPEANTPRGTGQSNPANVYSADFMLTNYWSDIKPSGDAIVPVAKWIHPTVGSDTNSGFIVDRWDPYYLDWPSDRLEVGRQVTQWMLDNCLV
jgi:hypothetical protein